MSNGTGSFQSQVAVCETERKGKSKGQVSMYELKHASIASDYFSLSDIQNWPKEYMTEFMNML